MPEMIITGSKILSEKLGMMSQFFSFALRTYRLLPACSHGPKTLKGVALILKS